MLVCVLEIGQGQSLPGPHMLTKHDHYIILFQVTPAVDAM